MVMFFTLLLMGVGLSMDAFAVSICKGLSMRKVNKKAMSCNWLILRRIPGTDAIYWLGTGKPV